MLKFRNILNPEKTPKICIIFEKKKKKNINMTYVSYVRLKIQVCTSGSDPK